MLKVISKVAINKNHGKIYDFYIRMEYIENAFSKLTDHVCILPQHKFLCRKEASQVFLYVLFSIASSISVIREWLFSELENKNCGKLVRWKLSQMEHSYGQNN